MIAMSTATMAISAVSTASSSILLRSASLFRISSDSIVSLGYIARDVLERHRTCDFIALVSSSVAVFLGLVCEYREIKHECTQAWKTHRRIKFIESPTPPLATIFGAIGWLLILVGVFGECWFELKVNRDDNDIVYINNVILEKTNESAKDAERSANRANEFALEAEDSANKANSDLREANKQLMELQEIAFFRHIDENRLVHKLGKKQFAGTLVRFEVFEEWESVNIMRAIRDALVNKANWHTGEGPGDAMDAPDFRGTVYVPLGSIPPELKEYGIWLEAAPKEIRGNLVPIPKTVAATEALRRALKDEGIAVQTRPFAPSSGLGSARQFSFSSVPDGGVHIFVSLKPFHGMPPEIMGNPK